jgi:hypothetical protein
MLCLFFCSNFAEQDRVCAAGKRAPAAHGVVGGRGAGAAELVAPAAETAPLTPPSATVSSDKRKTNNATS